MLYEVNIGLFLALARKQYVRFTLILQWIKRLNGKKLSAFFNFRQHKNPLELLILYTNPTHPLQKA